MWIDTVSKWIYSEVRQTAECVKESMQWKKYSSLQPHRLQPTGKDGWVKEKGDAGVHPVHRFITGRKRRQRTIIPGDVR